MRVNWTVLVLAVAAGMMSTPSFADSHGRPATAPPHPAPTAGTQTTTSGHSNHTTTPGAKSSTTSTTAPVQLNPIAAKIAAKPQLNARITALLPDGMTLNQASSGFKNQGQFIAALHVSQNLGIPFKDLKNDMTVKHLSLGQSIQDLKPTARSGDEARKAETAANHDLDDKR